MQAWVTVNRLRVAAKVFVCVSSRCFLFELTGNRVYFVNGITQYSLVIDDVYPAIMVVYVFFKACWCRLENTAYGCH